MVLLSKLEAGREKKRTLELWEIRGKQTIPTAQATVAVKVNGARLYPDTGRVLSWYEKELRIWETQEVFGKSVHELSLIGLMTHPEPILDAKYYGQDHRILSWDSAGELRIWRRGPFVSASDTDNAWKFQGFSGSGHCGDVPGCSDDSNACGKLHVDGAEYYPWKNHVLGWDENHGIRIWDADSGQQEIEPLCHDKQVEGAILDEPNSRILSWSKDRTVRLWNRFSGKESLAPMKHKDAVTGAIFNTRKDRILSWGNGRFVHLWDVATGQEVIPPLAHEGPVAEARFSESEDQILSWTDDRSVRVWDLPDGRNLDSSALVQEVENRTGTVLNSKGELETLPAKQ